MDTDTTLPGRQRISPSAVRYIKLGKGGALAAECLHKGIVALQHTEVPHELAATGDRAAIAALLSARSTHPGTVTHWAKEIREFYEASPETLWITFHGGYLWWGFAEAGVFSTEDGAPTDSRFRRIVGGWRNTNLDGAPLHTDQISTAITKTAGFRSTICRFKAEDRIIRLINSEENPTVTEARQKQKAFEASLIPIIRSLHQNDFEILTDLLFYRLGWHRIGALGGSQADTDLVLVQPATGQRALVQVKSRATQAVIDDYAKRFEEAAGALVFLVRHSPVGKLSPPSANANLIIWDGKALARKVSEAGLIDWLMEHAA